MCCKFKLHPDWMYVFRGRGIAMLSLFLLSVVGSICVQIMYTEISLKRGPNVPPPPQQRVNIGLRAGNVGLSNNVLYTENDNSARKVKKDKGAFDSSLSEIREYYRIWHRPETLLEKLMIWMCYFTFYLYNTMLTFVQIVTAIFFKTRGRDIYKLTNCFTSFINWMLFLLTVATVKETVFSIIAFTLEACICVYSLILQFNIVSLFVFEDDLQTEVRRYLSGKEEIPLEVFNYLQKRGFVRSRMNSLIFADREVSAGSLLDLGDVDRGSNGLEDRFGRTSTTAGRVDVESHV